MALFKGYENFSEKYKGSEKFSGKYKGSENFRKTGKGSENFWKTGKGSEKFWPFPGKPSDRVSGLKDVPPLIDIIIKRRENHTPDSFRKWGIKEITIVDHKDMNESSPGKSIFL